MAFNLAQKFAALGMATPLAKEYANQIQTGVYNWRRLTELGMIPALAKYVTESLAAGTFTGRAAMELSMTEAVANLTIAERASAFFDADYTNSRFSWDGQNFTDENAFNTAIGATKSGVQRVVGPYVSPSSPELLTNGDFSSGNAPGPIPSWTSVLNGTSTVAVVAGAASLTSDGSTGTGSGGAGISQAGTTTIDKAYRTLHDVLASTTIARIGGDTPTSSGVLTASQGAGVGYVNTFNAQYTSCYFYAARTTAGTTGVDNVSMKECLPLKNFIQGGGTAIIEGITPSVASGTKVVFELGHKTSQAITDPFRRLHLAYNASGNLVVDVRYRSTTTASFDLGPVAVSTPFKVKLGYKFNEFYAQLNDNGPILYDGLGDSLPGFGVLYIGRSALTDKNWDGGISRVRLYNGGGIDQFIGTSNVIHTEGDSFVAGNTAVSLPDTLRVLMGRNVYNTGEGGSTATGIRDRLVSAPSGLRSKTTVLWDGSENPITTVDEVPGYVDILATGITALGHNRFIVIPACWNYQQTSGPVEDAIRNAMVARWPNNFLDWRNVLPLTVNGGPTDPMFVNPPTDVTHLSQAAMNLMAAAIQQFINTKGW